jgi:UDP-N-acetylglucosamine--N-acetylmuramyl-(pentapeptide) pyrophosphoryl-undecaprenol N-acetylglucosamine transferase
VGNPVRTEIAQIPAPEQRWQARHEGLHLLVLGGSLGARALNKTLPAALAELVDLDIRVRHQCGAKGEDETRECYRTAGLQAEIEPFIADMAEAYAWADLVICRSGAMTVYELAAAGVGSILVPYPHAVDDHQHSNARYLSDNDAALIMAEEQMTPDSLASSIRQLAATGRLLEMATNARKMAVIDATRLAAEQCLEVAYE